jgi:small subunit ribosomal protein S2
MQRSNETKDEGFERIHWLSRGISGGTTLGEKMTDITMRKMLEAGVHFGHRVRFWNPKMAPYIFAAKNKIHIINLEKTLDMYKQAVNFLSSVAAKRGKILFVGTKQQARSLIRAEAQRCHMPYVDYRWLGGMLTNYKTIRQSLKRLKELEALRDGPTFSGITKKEALSITREITKLERGLGGIREMGGLPDAIFIIDVGRENIAVSEASKLKIPIVGVVDTNNSLSGIDYVIPGNDDSISAIKLYLQGIVDAIVDARSHIVAEEIIAEKENKKTSKKALLPKKKVFKREAAVKGGEVDKVSQTKESAETKTETTVKPKIIKTAARPKTTVVKTKSVEKKGKVKEAAIAEGDHADKKAEKKAEKKAAAEVLADDSSDKK